MHLIAPADEWLDALHAAHDMLTDSAGATGYGVAHLLDGDGRTKLLVPFCNTITDAGDTYNATRIVFGINSNGISAPTAASGMKLGTGTTAVSKSGGTGIALATYLTASNLAFDATYPQVAALGVNLGTNAVYKVTWAAGVATSATINEAVIVNDAATNATTTAANTYARTVFGTTINKASTDSLACTWNNKQLAP